MSVNRIVVFLTPVFAGAAGWAVAWAGEHLPGHPHLDPTALTALMVLGATSATAAAISWLHGWQKHEARLPVVIPTARPRRRLRKRAPIHHKSEED